MPARNPQPSDDSSTPSVILIAGPTASGKTGVAVELALRTDGEIISADSRQIYRYMDIASAKPSLTERRGIPHYGFDLADPDEIFSAGRFAAAARDWIGDIHKRGKTAIVAGGSGLYLQALVDGFFSGADIKDEDIRHELERRAERDGLPGLYDELRRLDPAYAAKTLPADRQRILRALEVVHAGGIRFSELHERPRDEAPWPSRWFGIELPRDVLYERINRRTERMLERGLLAETRDLLDRGYGDAYAMKSAGYEEASALLRGEIGTIKEMVKLIQRNTRRYAKRQLSWFRRNPRIARLDAWNRSAADLAELIRTRL